MMETEGMEMALVSLSYDEEVGDDDDYGVIVEGDYD